MILAKVVYAKVDTNTSYNNFAIIDGGENGEAQSLQEWDGGENGELQHTYSLDGGTNNSKFLVKGTIIDGGFNGEDQSEGVIYDGGFEGATQFDTVLDGRNNGLINR